MPRKKKSANPLDYVSLPELKLDEHAKRSIWMVVVLLFGLVSLLGLFNLSGHFGDFLSRWLTLIFGYGKWLVPLVFLYWALIMIRPVQKPARLTAYFGLFLLFVSYQTLFHFFIAPDNWAGAVESGTGGGYIGWYLSRLVYYAFGFWGGVAALFALLLIALVITFNTSLSKIIGRDSWLAKLVQPFTLFFKYLFSGSDEDGPAAAPVEEDAAPAPWQKKEVPASLEIIEEEEEEALAPAAKSDKPKVQEKIVWPKRSIKIDLPLELLNHQAGKAIGGDTALNAQKIQKTLEKFGIPVEMGDTKVGPTVTQYTFRPAEGVKLSRITTLNNDLSLALAAHPIRIEAPIPGQSLVGVEVPNRAKAVVGLREILEDSAFKSRKNNLYIALGKDVAGTSWLYDLTKMPHLLVAGATNSGKSVCLNSIIVSLLYQNNPDDLRFIMVDPKRVELPTYNGIPHLLTPVITDVNKTINALKWCLNEMERRYDILNKAGKRNIQSYNAVSKEKLPYIVFIIDELADFMMTSGKDMEAAIIRLAQMSRAIGIHLILATQRPSVDVITGLIKANVPTRIAFSVASLVDSKTILDSSGAEKLLGQGDMLFMCAEFAKPKRIQGAYLTDSEINDVVNYIKDKSGPAEYLEGVTDRQKVGGNAGVGLDGNHGDEDELFEEAKGIIIKAGKASTSMLQRRLSIGYGRAAKILDMLEEAGVIGPSNGAKPREVMISQAQYEAMGANPVSAMPVHNRAAVSAPDNYLGEEEEDDDEGNDDTLVFKGNSDDEGSEDGEAGDEADEEAETDEEEKEAIDEKRAEPDLKLTPAQEEEVIEDEDEILEEIRTDSKTPGSPASGKAVTLADERKVPSHKPNPLDDDDEMFFSK